MRGLYLWGGDFVSTPGGVNKRRKGSVCGGLAGTLSPPISVRIFAEGLVAKISGGAKEIAFTSFIATPGWTPNTTDRQNKRYQYGQQAQMAHWNLYQLAKALYPLIEATEPLETALNEFRENYAVEYPAMMRKKLGLEKSEEIDWDLIKQLEETLQLTETDMTIFFRLLGNFSAEKKGLAIRLIF